MFFRRIRKFFHLISVIFIQLKSWYPFSKEDCQNHITAWDSLWVCSYSIVMFVASTNLFHCCIAFTSWFVLPFSKNRSRAIKGRQQFINKMILMTQNDNILSYCLRFLWFWSQNSNRMYCDNTKMNNSGLISGISFVYPNHRKSSAF